MKNIIHNLSSDELTIFGKSEFLTPNTLLRDVVKHIVLIKVYGRSDFSILKKIYPSLKRNSTLSHIDHKQINILAKLILKSVKNDLTPFIKFIEFLKKHFTHTEFFSFSVSPLYTTTFSYKKFSSDTINLRSGQDSLFMNFYSNSYKIDFKKNTRRLNVNIIHSIDALLAMFIVSEAASKNVFILPVHDAFICD